MRRGMGILLAMAGIIGCDRAAHMGMRVEGERLSTVGRLAAGLVHEPFVANATTGFEAYAEAVEPYTLKEAERITGVPADAIRELAHTYARADRAQLCWTLGITEHHNAVDNVLALINLALLTGHVGRWGSGLAPLRGQNNVQGGGDMGAIPNRLPGGNNVEIDAQRIRNGKLSNDDFTKLTRAAGLLGSAPIWVDDTAGITTLEIRSRAQLALEIPDHDDRHPGDGRRDHGFERRRLRARAVLVRAGPAPGIIVGSELVAVARETSNGDVQLWDISNPAQPVQVGLLNRSMFGLDALTPHSAESRQREGDHVFARSEIDDVVATLAVRNRRPGDRFQPVGFDGHKKVQDLFVDRKVERARRDRVPIVVDGNDRIVWIAGYGIDEAFRVTDPAQAVLLLTVKVVGGPA